MIVIFISSENRGQHLGFSFSHLSPVPRYAILSLLRLLLCVFCQVLILFMTLSCVPTVKTPDKTSVSATKSAGSLLHLPLIRSGRAGQGRLPLHVWLQMCPLFPEVFRDYAPRSWILADTPGRRRGSCRALSETAWSLKCR